MSNSGALPEEKKEQLKSDLQATSSSVRRLLDPATGYIVYRTGKDYSSYGVRLDSLLDVASFMWHYRDLWFVGIPGLTPVRFLSSPIALSLPEGTDVSKVKNTVDPDSMFYREVAREGQYRMSSFSRNFLLSMASLLEKRAYNLSSSICFDSFEHTDYILNKKAALSLMKSARKVNR